MDTTADLAALTASYDEAVAAIGRAAADAHAQVDGESSSLRAFVAQEGTRPPLIPVPVDEPPPYVPPPAAANANALIPDTPLVDAPIANSSLAFDDAPLWQS
jgi:hypothetical protein